MNDTGGLKTRGIIKKTRVDKPLVSIVTPVFNGGRYLEETIRSVLGQTYDNIEYVVIDDGSTDNSLEIIRRYDNMIDHWLSKNNSGMYDTINTGLRSASGDIFAYINSDDLYYPDTVQAAVDYFQKHLNSEIVYGNCDFIGPKGEFIYNYRFPGYSWKAYISFHSSSLAQPATFWRSSIHKKIGYFDPSFTYAGDFDFYAKAGKCCSFSHIKKNMAKFRLHSAGMTATLGKRINDENAIVHQRYVRINKAHQFVLRNWLHLQIKVLNLPAMLKKAYFRVKTIDFY